MQRGHVLHEGSMLIHQNGVRARWHQPRADIAQQQGDPLVGTVIGDGLDRVVDLGRQGSQDAMGPQLTDETVPVIQGPRQPVHPLADVLDQIGLPVDDDPLERRTRQ
jgi:hypothetical protein